MTKPDWLNVHTALENVHDNVATIRTSLVRLCDGNYCAAILLDDFYFGTYMARDLDWHENRRNKNYRPDYTRKTTLEKAIAATCGMFDAKTILAALELLATKGYASIQVNLAYDIIYETNIEAVEEALGFKREEPKPREVAYTENIPANLVEVETVETISDIPPTPEPQRPARKESRVVKFHNRRAEMVALPATLTLEEWKATLEHFNNKCAYCLTSWYTVLEHYIPLNFGGGTTAYNCVPACNRCNVTKSDQHPDLITTPSMIEALKRVKQYLDTRMNIEEVAE